MNDLICTTNTITGQVKMTSLDIADMTGKLHKHVMRDIREELESIGKLTETIFGPSEYTDSTGRKLPCYEFGKAGAMQIALRYDAKTRYKVVKKIEELEQKGYISKEGITPKITNNLEATIKAAGLLGLKGNQALLSANMAIKNIHGIDCMATLGITHLIEPTNTQYFTPTILGKKLGLSAVKFNKLLEEKGYQSSTRDQKNKLIWTVTEKGKPFCQILDTNKKRSDGTPVQQIKWSKKLELKA